MINRSNMEVGLHDHGVYKSSKIQEGNNKTSQSKNTVDQVADHGEKKPNDDVSVAINDDDGRSRDGGGSKAEKVCRICHFGDDDQSSGDSQLISLGCDCRGELGFSHRGCAAVWFSQKGNRYVHKLFFFFFFDC